MKAPTLAFVVVLALLASPALAAPRFRINFLPRRQESTQAAQTPAADLKPESAPAPTQQQDTKPAAPAPAVPGVAAPAPAAPAPAVPAPAPQKQQEKYATCAEATEKVPGFTFVAQAVQQCPELLAFQQDGAATKTFFVPSDHAVNAMAESSKIPVQMLASPKFKGIMCNVLKYHVVDGVHLKKNWQVGQKLTTLYNSAELTISSVGQQPQITTATGATANIKRVVFCGNSVVFGTDAVLTPFKVPKLSLGH